MPFLEEVIFATPNDLNGDKASGLDGYTTAFWQSNWGSYKEDILKLFKDFHRIGKFVKSLNTTFIVMILKKGGVKAFKDYMPISLVGSLYKLIAKVLANGLKKVMSQLVNKAHNAFVEGRQILDAFLIANKVIDSMLRKKEKGILCKLDIEKAN